MLTRLLLAALLLVVASFSCATRAADVAADVPVYSKNGADTCLGCHGNPAVTVIFKTKHAVSADPHTPFGQSQCESCHGPGGAHTKTLSPGESQPPMPFFSPASKATVAQKNEVCLGCHQSGHRVGWQGSVHQREDVACVSCHQIHAEHDPVTVVSTQPAVCYQCHAQIRADFEKFSAHPVRQGDMGCTACHAPHDSLFPALLIHPTVNQTCDSCHAEKRGPFLWEHAPAAEDCGNCHVPHGSVNPALLVSRPPLLCQQCHASADHPSLAFTGSGLANGSQPSAFVLGGSCLNCHSQIHGSNAPSGANLNR